MTESPNPGTSMAITRNSSPAMSAIVVRNEALVPPSPCRQTSGLPVPPAAVATVPKLVRTDPSSNRPGSLLPVVAARKPTPRCRLRRTSRRPRRKAAMAARTSSAILAQVAGAAHSSASGSVEEAGRREARRFLIRTSYSRCPVTSSRMRALPPGTNSALGS